MCKGKYVVDEQTVNGQTNKQKDKDIGASMTESFIEKVIDFQSFACLFH